MKNAVLTIRLTNTQKAKLKQLADDAEMGISEYVRAKIEGSARCKVIAGIEIDAEQ